mmetsp:Transcript_5845/g.11399  ORF Transcript_5845/g.11399 Transcript_5845/m.11399 type:complete len:227 (-) Transcript_5845:124-804(-)|eukprot:6193128-Pleurochrysis_carterae.AAC.1
MSLLLPNGSNEYHRTMDHQADCQRAANDDHQWRNSRVSNRVRSNQLVKQRGSGNKLALFINDRRQQRLFIPVVMPRQLSCDSAPIFRSWQAPAMRIMTNVLNIPLCISSGLQLLNFCPVVPFAGFIQYFGISCTNCSLSAISNFLGIPASACPIYPAGIFTSLCCCRHKSIPHLNSSCIIPALPAPHTGQSYNGPFLSSPLMRHCHPLHFLPDVAGCQSRGRAAQR